MPLLLKEALSFNFPPQVFQIDPTIPLNFTICSVRRRDGHGGLQLSVRGHAVQEADILLRRHHLCPHLHDRLRVLDVLLVGPQVRPGQGGAHHHHPASNGHHHGKHQLLDASCGLHQGDYNTV